MDMPDPKVVEFDHLTRIISLALHCLGVVLVRRLFKKPSPGTKDGRKAVTKPFLTV